MAKINKRIEIVRSSKRGLSSMSRVSAEAARAVLAKNYETVRTTVVNDLDDLEALARREPDLVLLGMEYVPNGVAENSQVTKKVWLADYLEASGVACTGSDSVAHALQRSKPLAKRRVLAAGLQSAQFWVQRQGQTLLQHNLPLGFPLFVKPTCEGGGKGVDSASVARSFQQLVSKIKSIADDLHSDALIETYLPGREFSVAILREEDSDDYDVMPLELIAPLDQNGVRMLSGAIKSADAEQAIAISDPVIMTAVSELALAAFRALGARDYGRIDIRLDTAHVPHFLEANLIPSLISGYGSFPKACVLNQSLDYEAMILRIVRLGLERDRHLSLLAPVGIDRSIPALLPATV